MWGAVTFAALLTSFSALRPVRDALVLDGHPDQLPWLFLATFTVVSVVSPIWSKLLVGRSRPAFVPMAFHAFAVCVLGFCLLAHVKPSSIVVGRVYYVWSAVFNLFVVSVFWSLLADLLGPGTARRLYGPIAAGGTVGTFVGPLLTRLLAGTIGIDGMLMMAALLLELAVLGVYRLRRAAVGLARDDTAEPDAPAGGGAFTGIAHVASSRYLSTIAGYVFCTATAATFMYLTQAKIVHDALGGQVARTNYFASIELWVAAITFVLQTVIAAPALGRFGPGVVLAVLPLAQLAGISIVAAAPSLTALAIVQVISKSATHGLTRPARELLFTVISRDDKYRAKHAIDTIVYRFGDSGSSWAHKGLAAITAGSGALVAAAAVLVAAWLGFAFVLGAAFRRRVTKRVTKEPS